MEIQATDISLDDFEVMDDNDYELPSYSEVGSITVEILGKIDISYHPKWEWEIDRYSYDGSAFWINEGMGIDYFINGFVGDDIPHEGIWTIEGIVGHYYKGEWGFTDDDEDWEWTNIRPATEDEINNL